MIPNVMIKTSGLQFRYDQTGTLFSFPDISLEPGKNLLILGKSGIGKTTLLHLMAGLLRPETGEIHMNGTGLNALPNKKRDRFVGQHIGLVFQKNLAVRSLNVMENLQARLFFSRKKVNGHVIPNLLEQLNMADCKHKKANELSEGQLQRLGIALAVVHGPKVILADEPTSSLDDEHCQAVMELLTEQAKSNRANLVVITHDHRIRPLFQNVLTL